MPTVVVETIGATGEDHTTPSAWETATDDLDLVTDDEVRVGEMVDTTYTNEAQTYAVTGSGARSTTQYRCLRAAEGNEYDPIADTGARISNTTSGDIININTDEQGFRLENIGIFVDYTGAPSNLRGVRTAHAGATDCVILNVYVNFDGATGVGTSSFSFLGQSGDATFINCIAVGDPTTDEGDNDGFAGSACSTYHCASYNHNRHADSCGYDGIASSSGQLINCSAHTNRDNDFENGPGGTDEQYNAAGDTTASGTGSLDSVSLANMYNDASSEDYRPGSSTLAAGDDIGTTISAFYNTTTYPAYSTYMNGQQYYSFAPGVYHDDNGASSVSIGPYLEVPSSGPTNYTIDGTFDILVPSTERELEIDGDFTVQAERTATEDGDFTVLNPAVAATEDGDFTVLNPAVAETVDGDFTVFSPDLTETADGDFMVLSTQPATVDGDFTVTSVQGTTVDGDFEIVVESNAHTVNGAFALRVVNSIGSGRDYANLPAWESATDFDLVTSRTIIEGELYDDASSGVVFTVTGGTTDANYNRTLRPDAGSEYDPIADTGRSITMTNAAFPYVVGVDEDYFTLEHFEIVSASTASTSHGVRCLSGGSAEGVLVDSCVIRVPNITSGAGLANFTGDDMEFRNCLVLSSADAGIDNAGFGSTLTVNNCVVYAAAGAGIDASIGDITATNCHADSTGTALNLTSGTTCSASDTTGTAAELDSLVATDIFEDPANGDFRPQISGALAGAGTDLSGTFTEDFANATHGAGGSPWNIGAYEETTGATSYDISGSFLILIPQGETVDGDFTVLSTQSGTVDGDFVVLMSQAVTVDGDFVIVVVGTSTVDGGFQVLSPQTQTVDGDFLISQGMTATLDGTFRIAGQADTMGLEVSGNFMIFNLLTEFRNLERMVSILWRRKQ